MSAVYMSATTQLGYRSGGAAQKTFGNRWTKTFSLVSLKMGKILKLNILAVFWG